ncbi:hypothetical protein [Streptomyces griseosporeus]|uniref:hypothetical protein n=1 Tax=Streptomyces griseosporeus TaxID=1910 RepID=UPI0036F9E63F
MSTEARRAPIPPRPATPPPGTPARAPRPAPDQPGDGPAAEDGTAASRPGSAEDGAPREQGAPGFGSFPAAGSAPQSPPPPPASARFPDAPPAAGRPGPGESRSRTGGPARQHGGVPRQSPDGAAAQPRPGDGTARPGRPTQPTETPSETTTRLRPVPADPHPAPPASPAPTHPASPPPSAATRPGSAQPSPSHPSSTPPAPHHHAPTHPTSPTPPASTPHAPTRPASPHPGTPPGTTAGTTPGATSRSTPGTGPSAPVHPDAPSAPAGAGPWSPLPHPAGPDPALSWSAPGAGARPVVSFAEPERFDEAAHRVRRRRRGAAAAVCLVLGLGLIGGAVTGSWLTGDSGDRAEADAFATAGDLWHSVPVDQLFPPTVQGQGAGPGAADRAWTRIAVAPDSGCTGAFDPLLAKALAPVGCERLLRATYTDATQSYVTTVGLLFTDADATAMRTLRTRFDKEGLADRADLMPRPFAAKGTAADGFGDAQRASWTVSVLTDAPVVVYAVSGWADGRSVDTPQPAEEAAEPGATTAPAQAGLGNEAQGLADRIERGLRATASKPTEQPS